MANCCVSVLLPGFSFESRDAQRIKETSRMQLGVDDTSDFELLALAPLTQTTLDEQLNKSDPSDRNFEIGVRMNSPSFANFNLRNVENSMLEK